MFRLGISLPGTGTGKEQPRPTEDARQPTAAERVRTLVESSVSAVLTIPGTASGPETGPLSPRTPQARAVTADGDVVLLVTPGSTAAELAARARNDEVCAVMELTDVAPVSAPHRIRGRAWVAGWLTTVRDEEKPALAGLISERYPDGPDPSGPGKLLRLEVGEAHIDDLWGPEDVEPDDFAAAVPDPLVNHEAELLQHLDSSHDALMRSLSALLGERESRPDCLAVPLALDRHGMRVRFREGGAAAQCFDARFEFPEPVDGVAGLRRAMHGLFEAAADESRRQADDLAAGECRRHEDGC